MSNSITLSPLEISQLTGYDQPSKQLKTLKERGFYRAYIARQGGVVLERTHYEAVSRGEATRPQVKSANVTFMRKTA